MSYADSLFKSMCNRVLSENSSTEGQKVRPIWEDTGEPAYTIHSFGIIHRYDMRTEFPAITLRPVAIKSAMDEILWIYQKKSNNINDLKSHIWDSWADRNGSIGKAYGYQVGRVNPHHKLTDDERENRDRYALHYPSFIVSFPNDIAWVNLDQMDGVLYTLKHEPFSRRIITNLWNVEDLHAMKLQPCAYSCTFSVSDVGAEKPILNMLLNQRSQDILVANGWNTVQYALLLMMVAQVSDMIPGEFVHVIADAHIYDRHIPMVKELISREEFPAPTVTLDPDVKSFYDFTTDSVKVENYQHGEQIKNIPVAT